MGLLFEQIDSQPSALGEITLRRRRIPALGDRDIYEVKLGEEFLMSSMFVDAEVALADLGLGAVEGGALRVVVGGLGLGYTAEAALKHERVSELLVVDALDTVIHWHQQEKVPLGRVLNEDPRCRYVLGSFFDLAVSESGFDPEAPGKLFDAILLDIDHSPRALLNDSSASFYTAESLGRMASHIRPGGVFAMWSNEPPDKAFMEILSALFTDVGATVVSFYNPFQNRESSNTVFLARKPLG
ncbi:polyamine aminopropyltransferase [Marinobacter orientalis]|uniref:Spermidine synthase n=1 Tax=Marinobacter orientalis TaxID=1928859 RepID=A0A7Y0NKH3_9GAMM|nr:spermidine synthase [Marinobacter orientalis]NMT62562.1 spermidine synthase [Marinobacter orientalis]TGX51255.1 spermidine synthase [Marinobacter orientalis]